jgi:hypothetical protein
VGDLARLVHESGLIELLADRWDEHRALPPSTRIAVDAQRLVPVDETSRMLRDMLRVGWDNWWPDGAPGRWQSPEDRRMRLVVA